MWKSMCNVREEKQGFRFSAIPSPVASPTTTSEYRVHGTGPVWGELSVIVLLEVVSRDMKGSTFKVHVHSLMSCLPGPHPAQAKEF